MTPGQPPLSNGKPGSEIDEILTLFESRQKADKPLPEHRLLELGPEALVPLLNAFAREWRKCGEQRRRHKAASKRMLFKTFVFAAPVLLGLFRLGLETIVMLGVFFLGCLLLTCVSANRRGVLEFKDSRTHAVMTALMCVLKRWGVRDARCLTRDQRTTLCCVLGSCCHASSVYYDAMVAAAILRELEQVGESQALALVETLAGPNAVNEVHPVVYRAANRCLPILYQRSLQEGARATLLRPASAPVVPGEILLRPAQEGRRADPHLLLRPGPPGDDPDE